MKKAISILLIVVGSLFMITPLMISQMVKHESKIVMAANIGKNPSQKAEDIEGDFDYLAVEDLGICSLIEGMGQVDKDLMIGSISIPDLEILLPIMKGLTTSNLTVGAATMKPDQSFGTGNFTLSGHHMKNKDLLFGRLMDIQIGSMVYLSDGEKTYGYTIYETRVVPDDAMEMLLDQRADERGKAIVSLMTCYHSSKTGKRFFALGELDQYCYKED